MSKKLLSFETKEEAAARQTRTASNNRDRRRDPNGWRPGKQEPIKPPRTLRNAGRPSV